jgi:pimeloyl-ACP methyl ester carboxylesterase
MPEAEFAVYRAMPAWRARIAAAHTLARELRAERQAPFDPGQAAKITAPVLMLVGGDSPDELRADPETVAAALSDARITVLDGQQHIAIDVIPGVFAAHVVAFLRGRPI